jgi:SAM-dependent methyltransferase
MRFLGSSKDIKLEVVRFIENKQAELSGRRVVDVPAGSGVASAALKRAGAEVLAFDLFPELFRAEGISCSACDLNDGIPLEDRAADYLICQEGIEHLPDQLRALKEFNRVLKPGCILLVTTPNYSNLKGKLSYLLCESEYFHKIMPPNEVDDVWFGDQEGRVYLGHIFLTGIQRLRVLARLAGFEIHRLHFRSFSGTAFALMVLLYPLIYLSNRLTLARCLRKKRRHPHVGRIEAVYRELFKLNVTPGILACTHLFVEFRKVSEVREISFADFQKHDDTDFVT